jgi:hypothetical protein
VSPTPKKDEGKKRAAPTTPLKVEPKIQKIVVPEKLKEDLKKAEANKVAAVPAKKVEPAKKKEEPAKKKEEPAK